MTEEKKPTVADTVARTPNPHCPVCTKTEGSEHRYQKVHTDDEWLLAGTGTKDEKRING